MENNEIIRNLRQQISWCGDSPADRSIRMQCEERIRELLGESRSVEFRGSDHYPSSDDTEWRKRALELLQNAEDIFQC